MAQTPGLGLLIENEELPPVGIGIVQQHFLELIGVEQHGTSLHWIHEPFLPTTGLLCKTYLYLYLDACFLIAQQVFLVV